MSATQSSTSIREQAYLWLMTADPRQKSAGADALYRQALMTDDALVTRPPEQTIVRVLDPGRPALPKLVPPRDLPRRITPFVGEI